MGINDSMPYSCPGRGHDSIKTCVRAVAPWTATERVTTLPAAVLLARGYGCT